MEKVNVKLFRALADEHDTLGVLLVTNEKGESLFTCETLELPFKNNEHYISCIPTGNYHVVKVKSSRAIHEPHFIVLNVEGREGIAIHVGNTAKDTKGCILVGIMDETITETPFAELIHSRDTMNDLLAITPDSFMLEISDYPQE